MARFGREKGRERGERKRECGGGGGKREVIEAAMLTAPKQPSGKLLPLSPLEIIMSLLRRHHALYLDHLQHIEHHGLQHLGHSQLLSWHLWRHLWRLLSIHP